MSSVPSSFEAASFRKYQGTNKFTANLKERGKYQKCEYILLLELESGVIDAIDKLGCTPLMAAGISFLLMSHNCFILT